MGVGDIEGGGVNSGFIKAVKSKKTPLHPQVQQYVEERKQPTREKAGLQLAQEEEIRIQRPVEEQRAFCKYYDIRFIIV